MPKPKTAAQIRRMFGLAKPLGCAKEDIEDLAFDVTNGRTSSLAELTFAEANGVIVRLGGEAFADNYIPRRTQNHHKQVAGIPTIASAAHLQYLDDIWFTAPHRTAEGLASICRRTIKADRPRTAQECNKIVEAVKRMNRAAATDAAIASTAPAARRLA
ncbi:MAG: hypothetical protein IPM50_02745 [Acidobacteriota bacterium]|nr:MAG: hypothetical protein IPM50_02745 [Acidobacteriota bacterium]